MITGLTLGEPIERHAAADLSGIDICLNSLRLGEPAGCRGSPTVGRNDTHVVRGGWIEEKIQRDGEILCGLPGTEHCALNYPLTSTGAGCVAVDEGPSRSQNVRRSSGIERLNVGGKEGRVRTCIDRSGLGRNCRVSEIAITLS